MSLNVVSMPCYGSIRNREYSDDKSTVVGRYIMMLACLLVASCDDGPWLYGRFEVVFQPGEPDFERGVMQSNTYFFFVLEDGSRYELAPPEGGTPIMYEGEKADGWGLGVFGLRVRRGDQELMLSSDQQLRVKGSISGGKIALSKVEVIE